ncbi:MAG TPA: cob(I)yrinic acid a,c-diamide adenosyltransferase [Vulgatibacter sp.]|nr:cob(I)yrinic acid a,c-diamide adenosyltransferase [Vulgatibacter sp.]
MTFHIYTKTGDKGQTGLFGGGRVRKDDPRVEAYGAVDELNAAMGAAEAAIGDPEIKAWIRKIQDELFVVGSELATPDPEAVKRQVIPVGAEQVAAMEKIIDAVDEQVPPLRQFILPGGHPGSAHLHLARTICRRAERRVLSFSDHAEVRPEVIAYLNRLSDLLFMLARLVNHREGVAEPVWNAPLKDG